MPFAAHEVFPPFDGESPEELRESGIIPAASSEEMQPICARAIHIGDSIDLSAIHPSAFGSSLTVSVAPAGVAVLFRHGTAVLFNLEPPQQALYLAEISRYVSEPYRNPQNEDVEIQVDPNDAEGAFGGALVVEDMSPDHLLVIATVLDKNVVLSHYESEVGAAFDQVEPFAAHLEQKGRVGTRPRELLRHIGRALRVHTRTIARAGITDKPDLLWDHPELDRLYAWLEDEFEIRDRHRVLEQKVDLVSRTAETVLELIQTERALRLEWYIIALIVFEICLSLAFNHFG